MERFRFITFVSLVLGLASLASIGVAQAISTCTAGTRGIMTFSCAGTPTENICGIAPNYTCYTGASEPALSANQNFSCLTCTLVCNSGFADCTGASGCETQVLSGACTIGGQPGTYTGPDCSRACSPTPQYVSRQFVPFPGSEETGYINIQGNLQSASDIYLSNGKAIRIDDVNATALNIGNYDTVGNSFGLRLHAPYQKISELLFQQGSIDLWSISLRTPSRNLEFWKGNGVSWLPALTLDYANLAVGIGKTAPAYALDVAGDVRWTGILQGGFVPWARLTGFPTACPAGQYVSGVGGTLTCNTLAGGSLSGTGTANRVAKFTSATTLEDSIMSESGGTINVDGSITATSCFGPVFAGMTSTTVNGAITSGSLQGYRAAHARCASAFPGAHVCSTAEILESIRCENPASSPIFTATGSAWIANGAPALPTQTNDCRGWTYGGSDATFNGTIWSFDANGGVGWAQNCNSSYPLACCR